MKYEYTVITKDGLEYIARTFNEAKSIAKDYREYEPIIDRFDLELGELDGTYWTLENNSFVKH